MKTAVVLIIFKRPSTTERVFETIRQAKPPKLFIIADGPRPNVPGEAKQCALTRAVVEQVDWDCQVYRNYSETNIGCAKRLPTGLDWVFEQVEEAIVLEDDCVPHPTFFSFCEELLERFKDDERIALISGQNAQSGQKRGDYSYYFSRYTLTWGWATWRRAWQNFDFYLRLWPEAKAQKVLQNSLDDSRAIRYWTRILQTTYENPDQVTWWDYQWLFACWIQQSLSIIPNVNLVSNIGSGADSTHTVEQDNRYLNLPATPIEFPLRHPLFLQPHLEADRFTHNTLHNPRFLMRLEAKLQRIKSKLAKKYF
jgi:hypothetical protein